MKSTIKRCVSGIVAVWMLLSVLLMAVPVLAVADAFADWDAPGWEPTTEGGTPVISHPTGVGLNRMNFKGATTANTIRFAFRVNELAGTVDGNVGVIYTCSNGVMYFCEYNAIYGIVRLRRFGTDGSDSHLGEAKSFSVPEGDWHSVAVTVEENLVRWTVDGELMHEVTSTGGDPMTGGIPALQGYNTAVSFRNIQIESEKIDIVPKQTYDFEFTTEDSVAGFTADMGQVAWNDGTPTTMH